MSKCDQKYLVVDYFFEELKGDERRQFKKHLDGCDACQEHLTALASASRMTRRKKRAKPGKELLRNYHLQLENSFSEGQKSSSLIDRILDRLILRPSIAIRLAEAMVLIFIGFFIGKISIDKPAMVSEPIFLNDAASYSQGESLLLKNYLQQTEMVLLDVKNLDPIEDQELIFNLIQSAKYRHLLQKTLLLRKEAKDLEDHQLSQLLNKIELILLELDNLETNGYVETMSMIKKQLKDTPLLIEIKSLNKPEI